MKKQLQELISEFENRLAELKKIANEEEMLWNVDEICKAVGYTNPNSVTLKFRLEIVAAYCNDRDEKAERRYYPTYNLDAKKIILYSSVSLFATPHFNSSTTLQRLIDENQDFFNNLLIPKE